MKKLLCTLSLFCVILSCSPTKKYAQSRTDYWEREISELEKLDKTENYSKEALLFIGSSSIRLWKNIEQDMAPYEAIRRGYGGAHFYDLIHYVDRLVKPHDVKGVVIFVANDISGSENDLSPNEVVKLFKYTTKRIQKLKPGVPIFQVAITPTPSRWKVYPQTRTLNKLLKDYCSKEENLFFIDTQNNYLKNGEPRPSLFIQDQLHLNQKGYDLWASIIKKELDKVYP